MDKGFLKKITRQAEKLMTNHPNLFYLIATIIFAIYCFIIVVALNTIAGIIGTELNSNQVGTVGADLALWGLVWLVAIQSAKNRNSLFYKNGKGLFKRHLFFIITSLIMALFPFANFYFLFFGGLLMAALFFILF